METDSRNEWEYEGRNDRFDQELYYRSYGQSFISSTSRMLGRLVRDDITVDAAWLVLSR